MKAPVASVWRQRLLRTPKTPRKMVDLRRWDGKTRCGGRRLQGISSGGLVGSWMAAQRVDSWLLLFWEPWEGGASQFFFLSDGWVDNGDDNDLVSLLCLMLYYCSPIFFWASGKMLASLRRSWWRLGWRRHVVLRPMASSDSKDLFLLELFMLLFVLVPGQRPRYEQGALRCSMCKSNSWT